MPTRKTDLQAQAEAFIPLAREIITETRFMIDSCAGRGQKRMGWIVIEFPWGNISGYSYEIANRIQKKLYTEIGERYARGTITSDEHTVATERLVAWCDLLDRVHYTS